MNVTAIEYMVIKNPSNSELSKNYCRTQADPDSILIAEDGLYQEEISVDITSGSRVLFAGWLAEAPSYAGIYTATNKANGRNTLIKLARGVMLLFVNRVDGSTRAMGSVT